MNKKLFYTLFGLWFVIVNLPQFVPSLNRIEPFILGIPFNMVWIWVPNLLITILIIVYLARRKNPNTDWDEVKQLVKKDGLEVNK
ncbi:hypothetical protein [Oceanobacillus halotolerans]|uniref:hypothetical protein n=1 Tax=Oceanobacillus halotolerans TaxID=2663380 RepID=UPI0013D88F52|nr:hypothetical protein [Oceanobacillus halotolerans]